MDNQGLRNTTARGSDAQNTESASISNTQIPNPVIQASASPASPAPMVAFHPDAYQAETPLVAEPIQTIATPISSPATTTVEPAAPTQTAASFPQLTTPAVTVSQVDSVSDAGLASAAERPEALKTTQVVQPLEKPMPTFSRGDSIVPPRQKRRFGPLFRRVGVATLALLLIGGGAWFLIVAERNNNQANSSVSTNPVDPASRFQTLQVPLNELASAGSLVIDSSRTLSINGQLRVNNSLIINPTSQPAGPVAGQMYYDQANNVLAYYNGSSFVDLRGDQNVVTSLGGATGAVTVGNGLGSTNGSLINAGVLSVQGQTGAVTFTNGNGIAITGTTLSNTGVLSLGGQTGDITLGNGLNANNGTLQNTGVLSVASGSANITVTNDGSGNVTISSSASGGTGTVSSSGGTAGHLAKFTGVQTIADSLVSESGTAVTIAGDLSITGSLTLTSALNVANGGTGTTSLTNNGVVIGQGTSALATVSAGAAGQCLVSTVGAPTFQACPGSGGVSSLNGLNGALTLANASAAGSTITINDASTLQKGIAQFNSSNFTSASGVVNTIQDISSSASPTFAGLTLTSPLTVANGGTGATTAATARTNLGAAASGPNSDITSLSGLTTALSIGQGGTGAASASGARTNLGAAASGTNSDITSTTALNTITPSGALTIGATSQSFLLQGNVSSSLVATNGTNTTTIGFTNPTANVTINFPALVAGTYSVCTTSGNCSGSGGGVTTPGGTAGVIPKFTGSQTLANSIISDNGTTVTISGAGVIQGNAGLTIGAANTTTGKLVLANATNANTLTLQSGATASNLAFTLPTADGTNNQCLSTNGSGVLSFETCLTGSGSGSGVISLDSLSGALTLANSSGAGSVVTIDNASTSQKGIAQFNSTNFTASSGTINTIQDIATTASPTFASLTLSSPLTVPNGGTGGTSFTTNGVLYGNGSSALQITAAAANSILATNISNVPSFTQTLPTAVQGNITSVGAVTAGSIGTGFGAINTTSNITTSLTVQGGIVNATSGFQLAGTNINTAGTLSNVAYLNAVTQTFSGVNTFSRNGSGTSDTTLAVTGTPINDAASSLIRIANAIASGNTATNGGTYIGLNEPSSGAGSAADFLNFQQNGTSTFKVSGSGAITANSANTTNGYSVGGTSIISSGLAIQNATGVTSSGTITFSGLNAVGVVQTNSSGVLSTSNLNLQTGPVAGVLQIVNGGTGANNASNARMNLSAAQSGANADITSTSVLNTITPTNTLTIGATSQAFILQGNKLSTITATDGANVTTVGFVDPTASATLNFPALAAGTYSICTTSGNCSGAGGGVTTPGGTANTLAKFTGSQTIGNSSITDNGTTVTLAGSGIIQGSSGLTIGVGSTTTGKLVLQNATNNNTLTLQSGVTGSSISFTLPVADGSNTQCLSTNGSGVLAFENCLTGSGSGGGVSSLDGLVGVLTLANSSGAGSTVTINDASTAQKGIAQFNSTNFTASSGTINTIQDIATSSSPSFTALNLTGSSGLTVGTSTTLGKIVLKDGNAATFGVTIQVQPPLTTNQTLTVPDATGIICLQNSASCGFATSSGSGSYIQNQNSVDQTANFRITGTGQANTSILTPLLDTISAGALNIGTTNATAVNLNQSTSIAAGKNLTFASGAGNFDQSASTGTFTTGSGTNTLNGNTIIAGSKTFSTGTGTVNLNGATTVASNMSFTANGLSLFEDATNSTTAFQVQNSSAANLFTVDTTNGNLVLGNDGTPAALTVRGGAATGTSVAGANLTFDASNGTGLGGSGDLIFRTAASSGGIAFDASTTANQDSFSATLSWTHTATTNSNRAILVSFIEGSGDSVQGVTYGASTLSLISSSLCASSNCKVELWGTATSVPSGANTVTATWTSARNHRTAGAMTFYNVNTSSPFGTAPSPTTGSSSPSSITVNSTNTQQLVVDAFGFTGAATWTPGSGQTQAVNQNNATNGTIDSSYKTGAASTTSMSWTTGSATNWGHLAVAINAAVNNTPDTLADRLHIAASGNIGINTASPAYTLDVQGDVNTSTAYRIGGASINTAGTLSNVAYLNAASQTFTGINSFSRNGTGTGDATLIVSGTPINDSTSSLIRIGNAIASGNNGVNGGTYVGLNEPSSGAGSAADFLNFQQNGTSTFKVTGAGAVTANTSILTPLLDTATAVALNIGTTSATAINLNQNTTVASNKSFTANGTALFKDATNATAAFQVQNSSAANLFTVDTTNGNLVVGNDGTPSALTIRGGAATASNTIGSNITFDASNGTGTGGSGDFIFRTAAANSNPIALDATSNSTATGQTSLTWSHTTTASQSNLIMVVGIGTLSSTNNVSSVTYNGASLTKISNVNCPAGHNCDEELWYMINPSTGTHNVVVTLTGSDNIFGGAATYYNVNQTTPLGTAVTNSGGSSPSSVTVTTNTGQTVIDGIMEWSNGGLGNVSAGQTQLWRNGGPNSGGSSKPGAASSTNVGWSINFGNWAEIAVPINPVANTTPDTLQDRFHIASSGNVGINTATPAYTLDVQGDINASGAIRVGGASINTAGTLSNVAYLNAASQTFTGINSFSRNGTGASDATLAITGTPVNNATSSLIRIGNSIASGNNATNGGTYIGLNEPSSGAGSVADFLNFQQNGTSTFSVSGAGTATAATSLLAPLLDTASAVALNVGTTNATAINLNQNTTVASNKSFTANGAATFKDATNSTTAFQVQNSSAINLFAVDTTNNALVVGHDGTSQTAMTIRGGAATGTNATGANLTIAASNGTGTGGSGDILFQTAGPAIATPTDDGNDNTGSAGSNTSLTFSHTVAVNSNRILVVGISTGCGFGGSCAATVSSVTYGGVSLTKLNNVDCSTGAAHCHIELWYLTSPATGANNVVISTSGTTNINAGASSYYNVDSTTPFGTSATGTGAGNPSSLSVTSNTTQLVVDVITSNNVINSPSAGQTQRYNANSNGPIASSTKPGAASTTSMGWSDGSSDYATIGAGLNPPSGTTSNTLLDRLHITASGNVGINTATPGYALDVNGGGNFASYVLAPVVDTASAATLTLGNTNATAISMGNTTNNIQTTVNGTELVKPTSGHNSATAFQVQNASAANLFTVDTTNTALVLGNDVTPAALTVRGGAATGSNVAGTNITVAASNGTGTGGSGDILFQTAAIGTPQFDANSSTTGNTVSSLTWSHTVASQSNRILVVGVATTLGQTVSTVTYNGVGLTKLTTEDCASTCHDELWYLKNPATGTNSIVVTFSASTSSTAAGATSYYNVDQTTPFGTAAVNTSGSTTPTVAVTTTANQLVIDSVASRSGAVLTATSPQIQRWNAVDPANRVSAGSSQLATTTTTTMSWTSNTNTNWAEIGVGMNAAATASDTLADRLHITAAGNIGINTATPNAQLQVATNGQSLFLGDNTNTSVSIGFNGSTRGMAGYDGTNAVLQGGSGHGIKLNVNNSTFGSGTVVTINSSGAALFENNTNSTTAFQVQNSSAANLFTVDTSNTAIVLGNDVTPTALTVRGGAATGSNVTGGTLTFDASNGTGGGGSGDLIFRTANASGSPTVPSFDTTSTGPQTNGTSITWNHTVGTNINRLLLVSITTGGSSQTVTALTYNGVSMTKITSSTAGSGTDLEFWYLKNPASGTHAISASITGGATNIWGGADSFYNVDQTTPLGTAVAATGTGTTASNSVTSTTNQLVADTLTTVSCATPAAGGGQTQDWTSTGSCNAGSHKTGTASTTSMSWTWTGSTGWADIAVPINVLAATTSDTLTDRLHITSAGNIGINNSAPTSTLDVAGTARIASVANSTSAFQVQNANGTTLFGVDTTAPSGNLLTNPGFEVNTAGWQATGTGASIARNTTASNTYMSVASLQVTLGSGAGTGVQITSSGYSGGSLAAGTYTFGFYAMSSATVSAPTVSGFNGGTCNMGSGTVLSAGFQRFLCNITTTGATTGNISITFTTASQTVYIDGAQLVSGSPTTLPSFSFGTLQTRGTVTTPFLLQNTANSTAALRVMDTNANTVFSVDTTNDRVGIGVSGADTALTVGTSTSAGAPQLSIANTASGGGEWYLGSTDSGNSAGGGKFTIGNTTTTSAAALAIDGSNNVGIGTTSPNALLTLNGSGAIWSSNNVSLYDDSGSTKRGQIGGGRNGDLGIVSTESGKELRIGSAANIGFWMDGNANNTDSPGIIFANKAETLNTGWNAANSLSYFGKYATSGRSINAAGSVNSNGGDYAEYFYQQTDGALQKGDVVTLNASGKVEKGVPSDQIMGVVSTNAGFVGNDLYDANHPEKTALVGLVGQIPTFVTTENGQIHVGDALVASKTVPGAAMKATSAGMTIGKALEDYTNADTQAVGQITVFVSPTWYDPAYNMGQLGSLSDQISQLQGQVANLTQLSSQTAYLNRPNIFKGDGMHQFEIQNTQGQALFVADTTNMRVTVANLIVTGDLTVNGHIIAGGTAPTIAAGSSACVTPTVVISGTDSAGMITVTTGTQCATTGKLATITFANAFAKSPEVVVTPADEQAGNLQTYVDSATISTTAFDLVTTSTSKPAAATVYKWYYHVIQ